MQRNMIELYPGLYCYPYDVAKIKIWPERKDQYGHILKKAAVQVSFYEGQRYEWVDCAGDDHANAFATYIVNKVKIALGEQTEKDT